MCVCVWGGGGGTGDLGSSIDASGGLVMVLTVSGVMAYHYREKQRQRLRRCVC